MAGEATADASRLCLSFSVVAILLLWLPVWWYTTCSSHRPLWGVLPIEQEIRGVILDPPPLVVPERVAATGPVESDAPFPTLDVHLRVLLLHPTPHSKYPPLLWDAVSASQDIQEVIRSAFEDPPAVDVHIETQFYGPGELPCSPTSGLGNPEAVEDTYLSKGLLSAVCFTASADSALNTPYSLQDPFDAPSQLPQVPQRPFVLVVPPPHHLCSSPLTPQGPSVDTSSILGAHLLSSPVSLSRSFTCPGGISGVVWQPGTPPVSDSWHLQTAPRNCCLGSGGPSEVDSPQASKVSGDTGGTSSEGQGEEAGQGKEAELRSNRAAPEHTCCPCGDVETRRALISHVRDRLGVGEQGAARHTGAEQEKGRESHNHVVTEGQSGVARVSRGDVDLALREALGSVQERIRQRLSLLLGTLEEFPNVPLSKEVQQLVNSALHRVSRVRDSVSAAISSGQEIDARTCGDWVEELKEALALATEAAFHPSLLMSSYNPWEHYLAIYSPLLLPLFLHGVVSFVKEYKLWRKAKKSVN